MASAYTLHCKTGEQEFHTCSTSIFNIPREIDNCGEVSKGRNCLNSSAVSSLCEVVKTSRKKKWFILFLCTYYIQVSNKYLFIITYLNGLHIWETEKERCMFYNSLLCFFIIKDAYSIWLCQQSEIIMTRNFIYYANSQNLQLNANQEATVFTLNIK